MISGFVLFNSGDLQAIIEFAVSVQLLGDLNTMVYNATFAALSFANGQADPSQRFYALTDYRNTSMQARGFNQVNLNLNNVLSLVYSTTDSNPFHAHFHHHIITGHGHATSINAPYITPTYLHPCSFSPLFITIIRCKPMRGEKQPTNGVTTDVWVW